VDHDYVVELAQWAKRMNARCFAVVSSIGASASSGNFYLRTKGEMERDISAAQIPSVHIFRPSFLVGERAEHRPGERLGIAVAKVIAPLMIGRLRRYRPIAAEEVARAMLDAAKRAEPGVHMYEFGV
jgi:uncharacterized protein YbjT (DUF2867 family)